jgi:hypothetical protein
LISARVNLEHEVMRRYRVGHSTLELERSRREMLASMLFEEDVRATTLILSGSPLLVAPTLDDMLRTVRLSREDLVET